MGASALFDACNDLLAVALAAADVGPGGQINVSYVSPSVPSWDVPDQLTVHVGAAVEGNTRPLMPPLQLYHRVGSTGVVNMVVLTVTVLRQLPVVGAGGENLLIPDPVDIQAASERTTGDLWAIWHSVAWSVRNGTLFSTQREFSAEAAVPLPAQGGIVGWQIPFGVQIDGYDPFA